MLIVIFVFLLMPLNAQDEAASSWWLDRTIAGFTSSGLRHVDSASIDDITYPYIGKKFTDELFQELHDRLYEVDGINYFTASVSPAGTGSSEIIIAFDFVEFPSIASIEISGATKIRTSELLQKISIKQGDFILQQEVAVAAEALTSYYREKGYAGAVVTGNSVEDQSTNTLQVTFTVIEDRQSKVKEIAFEGNSVLSSRALRRELTTKQKSLFNPGNFREDNLRADTASILAAYSKNGYIDAKVVDIRQEEIPQDNPDIRELRLVYVVEEGVQWYLGSISVEGNEVFTDEELLALINIREGDVLNIQTVNAQLSRIGDLYWNNGYIFNNLSVSEQRNEETRIVDFTITVVEYQQAVVEDILINGLTKTKPYVFERELTIVPGDIFSKSEMDRSAQNLYNTGLLTDVKYDIRYGSEDGQVILDYTVEEGNQIEVQFGATFGGNVDGFPVSGFLMLNNKNLGGTARKLSISTEISPDDQSVELGLSNGWVGDKRWSNGVSLSFSRSQKTNVPQRAPGGEYYTWENEGSARPWGATGDYNGQLPDSQYLMDYVYYRLALGYTTGYTFMFDAGRLTASAGLSIGLNHAQYDDKYDPFEKLISQYHEGWKFSNRLTLSLTWDGRDLIENTTKGYVLSQSFTYAGGLLGGLSNYIRLTTSAAGYLTVFETQGENPMKGVVSLSTSLNFMLPQYWNKDNAGWNFYDPRDGATKYEMLYLDGMSVGRGFQPVFGQSFMWDTMLELSVPLVQNLLAAEVFTSATALYGKQVSTLSFSGLDWYFAGGVGVKLSIPGFPLGLYLVKNATVRDGNPFAWESGTIFNPDGISGRGLSLVLAITTSLY